MIEKYDPENHNLIDNFIQEIKCLQDENDECGDLEDRFGIIELLDNQIELKKSGNDVNFLECGLCRGEGKHTDYEDEWMCRSCFGLGGKWVSK